MLSIPSWRTMTTLLAATGVSLALSTSANATNLSLWLDIGGVTSVTTGTDSIFISGTTINGVNITGEFAQAISGSSYTLNWSALTVTNTNSTPITISGILSASGFSGPANYAQFSQSGTFTNSSGSSIAVSWYDDPRNVLGGSGAGDTPGDLLGSYTSAAATGASYSLSYNSGLLALSDPDMSSFSMTEAFTYTLDAGGQLVSRGTNIIKTYVPVPEPRSLLLLGVGLLGVSFFRRLRHQAA